MLFALPWCAWSWSLWAAPPFTMPCSRCSLLQQLREAQEWFHTVVLPQCPLTEACVATHDRSLLAQSLLSPALLSSKHCPFPGRCFHWWQGSSTIAHLSASLPFCLSLWSWALEGFPTLLRKLRPGQWHMLVRLTTHSLCVLSLNDSHRFLKYEVPAVSSKLLAEPLIKVILPQSAAPGAQQP